MHLKDFNSLSHSLADLSIEVWSKRKMMINTTERKKKMKRKKGRYRVRKKEKKKEIKK